MKKFLVVLMLLALVPQSAFADTTISVDVFPDLAFMNFVRNFDTDNDGVLQDSETASVISIDVEGMGISSLQGIELFTHLQFLNCGANSITSLNLSANTELRRLYCRDLNLASLNVTGLPELTHLWCWNDGLSELDLTANTKLESLMCYSNDLRELKIYSGAPLSELACSGLPLEDTYSINTIIPLEVDAENGVILNANREYAGISSQDIIALDSEGKPIKLVQFSNVLLEKARAVFESAPVFIKYSHNTGNERAKLTVSLVSEAAKAFAPASNGIFVGTASGDVLMWKGVPYAKQPTGSLRWKAPEAPEDTDEVFEAFNYAATPLQHYSSSNPRELMPPHGEECLALNVWNNSRDMSALKPVMVWVHGGAFNSGGTGNPDYEGRHFIEAHDDVLLVSVGYRVGLMGFIDFVNSGIPGCENFPDSQNLGLLDILQAMRWIKENIAAFGGDPENITVLGQSSGGATVSLLVSMPEAVGLFQRAVIQSGGVSMTAGVEECLPLTQALVKLTGAGTMDELMALSSADLQEATEKLQALTNFPERDGRIVAANPYEAFAANAANFDLLTGSMQNEVNYYSLAMESAEAFSQFVQFAYYRIVGGINAVSSEDAICAVEFVIDYMTEHYGASETEAMADFLNYLLFRGPVLTQANMSAGKKYVYYWEYPSWIPGIGACHALDIPYVFNDRNNALVAADFNQTLADEVQAMWINFAKTGDPSTSSNAWPEYDLDTMGTMIISDSFAAENGHRAEYYALIQPLMKYGISGRELVSAIAGGTDDITPDPESEDVTPTSPDITPTGVLGSSGSGCNAGFMFPMMLAVLVFAAKKKH